MGLYAAGVGEKLTTLALAQQPNRFWADDSTLARAAEPLPVLIVSGCLEDVSQRVFPDSSVRLVVAPHFPDLFTQSDSQGSYNLRVPQTQIGTAIPAQTALIATIEGLEAIQAPIDLRLGSQTVDLTVSAQTLLTLWQDCQNQCLLPQQRDGARCLTLDNLIAANQCINAVNATWLNCLDTCNLRFVP